MKPQNVGIPSVQSEKPRPEVKEDFHAGRYPILREALEVLERIQKDGRTLANPVEGSL